jgi:hypothetical protein
MPAEMAEPDPYALVETWEEAPKARPKKSEILALHPDAEVSARTPVTAYPTRQRGVPAMEEDEAEFSWMRDRIVPIVLLVGGFGLRIGQIPVDRTLAGGSVAAAIAMTVCQVILTMALMLAGVFIAAKLLGVNFGPVGTAVLKLCAMAVFAWAAATFAIAVSRYDVTGGIVAIHLIFITYAGLFWALFSLDVQEVALTTVICGLLQLGAACAFFGGKM